MFILQNTDNKDETFKVSKNFVERSGTLSNMLDDLNCWDNEIPIPLSIDFKILEKFISLFQKIEIITCSGKNVLDYLVDDIDIYIHNYPEKNIEPPFQDKVIEIYQEFTKEEINSLIKIADFLDMKGVLRFISLVFAVFIKNMENYDEKVDIYRRMRGHIN
jgi:hypothetical protein|tara:strand:- start:532 stop:1014 length:483 start_codon:yes stop_codon:yes gene_type:complete